MPTEQTSGKPTTRRYSVEEKQAAVRMVRSLQAETGQSFGAVMRVAGQLASDTPATVGWTRSSCKSPPFVSTPSRVRTGDLLREREAS